ncbi:MAG TPA: D-2-hydroxyacid dehydrogenase family protein [Acidimicrobiales bacterium]|nr:D-2-hydroxyacid dehydrogenase family protein [Acidimicrobiales bacterium]
MRVTILDDWFSTIPGLRCFAKLAAHEVTVRTDHLDDVDALAEALADTECLVLIRERTAVRAPLLERLPALRLISQRSVHPHIDVAACTRLGIVVSSDMHPGTPSWATAELTWALVLASFRQLPAQVASLRAGRWQAGVGRTLRGRTLGVHGYGRIGAAVSAYGRAFGMDVGVWASAPSRERAAADGHRVTSSKQELYASSDVVTLHLRLVPATRGAVSAADLALMRPDAVLVNTSRAELLEPGALVAALRTGRPGGAAVDVFEREPLTDTDDPLLAMPNVVATPHIGYVTEDEWERHFSDVFDQVNAFAAGAPTNVVNPEVLARRRPLH